MKKLLALSIVLSLVAGAVVAQVPDGLTIAGWGRADFVPIQGTFTDSDPAKNLAWTGVGSGWGPAHVRVDLKYSSEKVGAWFRLNGDGTTSGGDYIGIWVKPFGTDILKIDVGKFLDETLRGPSTDVNTHGFIGGPGKNGDAVFQRFAPNGGALFFSKPIPALSVFLQVNPGWDTLSLADLSKSKVVDATDTWKKVQAGLAYDIEGIGLARAQYVGGTNKVTAGKAAKFEFDPATYDGTELTPTGTADLAGWKYVKATDAAANFSRIEAAFKFTMIDGLTADLGAKIPLPVTDDKDVYMDNVQINLAGSFAAGDFGITYGLYSGFGGNTNYDAQDDVTLSPTFNLILVPSYFLAAIDARVGADLGMKLVGDSSVGSTSKKDGSVILGFGAWVQRNLGKGSIKVGAAYQLPKNKFSNDDSTTGGTKNETGYFSLPIILEFSY
jgi:hypothetical protein